MLPPLTRGAHRSPKTRAGLLTGLITVENPVNDTDAPGQMTRGGGVAPGANKS